MSGEAWHWLCTMRNWPWRALSSLLLVALSPVTSASDEAPSIKDFQRTTWTAQDGVLPDTWAIAQTSDGWLWFGGPNGLTRFDGVKFEKVEVVSGGSLSSGISALFATASGPLLIGHRSGGVSILDGGKFTPFDNEQTKRAGGVYAFAQEATGVIWASARNGLLRFDGRLWQVVGREWNYPGGYASGVLVDSSGTLWVANGKGLQRLPQGGHRFKATQITVNEFADFIQSSDGRFWYVDALGISLLPGQSHAMPRTPSFNSRTSSVALFDQRDVFWNDWLVQQGAQLPASTVRDLQSIGIPKTFLEDREGNVWIGDQYASIHRVRRPVIVRLSALPTITRDRTPWASFAVDHAGSVWIATEDAGVKAPADGVWQIERGILRAVQPDQIKKASAITRDADGTVWVGNRDGVWRFENGRFVKALDIPGRASIGRVSGLTVKCAGGEWISLFGAGLLRHDGTGWKINGDVRDLPASTPAAQTCDSANRLWLGYGDGTVARVDAGQAASFSAAQGLQVGAVSAILAGRRTLVAGERGLALLIDGWFRTLKAGMPAFEGVTGIIESSNGDVWLNGVRGLARIEAVEIDRVMSSKTSDVATELFDINDGYPVPAFSALGIGLTSLAQAGDGRIWFAAHGGVASLDPSQVRRESVETPLVIRSLSLGGHPVAVATGMRLPEGTRNLEISYAALNYSHPDRLRFRYRLDGSDASWVDADTRRQAFYTNLGPGTYRFVVNATNEKGVWTDQIATLDFVIPPTFVQSQTFLALCIAAGLGAVFLLYRLRVQQLTARERMRLEERVGERERIARELHDTLLQGTQSLILSVHMAAKRVPAGDPAHQMLEQALDRADEVLAEGRDRIQDLRVADEAHRDLPEAIAAAGSALASGASTKFSVLVEGTPRELMPMVKGEAYRIGREALLNAFQHAQAASVEAQIVYGDRDFRLRVRDDGMGIDQAAPEAGSKPGHWGLQGMRERSRHMGAQFAIWSRPGAGTEIELAVPAALAYVSGATDSRWFVFRPLREKRR